MSKVQSEIELLQETIKSCNIIDDIALAKILRHKFLKLVPMYGKVELQAKYQKFKNMIGAGKEIIIAIEDDGIMYDTLATPENIIKVNIYIKSRIITAMIE